MASGRIFVGVGGWDYDPWRGSFYPQGLARSKQLAYMAGRLGAVEVNATYYKLQSPELFERWAAATPPDFRFALKASRYCTNRKDLAVAGEGIGRFCAQGFTRLGERLGPILWQFMATKRFDPAELRAFLGLLPAARDGVKLRHALEVRHESFRCREFVAMARSAGVAVAFADHPEYPCIADLAADFVYARLQGTREEEEMGYSPSELDRWAGIARTWAAGESPEELAYVSDARAPATPRDVYLFVIGGAKHRNPAAAQALIERLA